MSDISATAPAVLTTSYLDNAASASLSQAAASASGGQNIDKVSTDFEAVFLSQMMGSMFSGDELTSFFGGGTEGEVYKSLMLNEYGKAMAKSGGIGIASQVKKELLKLQEVA